VSYLMIDHRGGQNPNGSRGTLIEYDTTQCPHCGGIVERRKRKLMGLAAGTGVIGSLLSTEDTEPDPGDTFCDQCHKMVCSNPECRRVCAPFMKKLLENAARKEQSRKLSEVLLSKVSEYQKDVKKRKEKPTWIGGE